MGRWPWPRLVHAQLLNFLARGPVRVVGYDVLFTEHDRHSYEIGGENWTGAQSDAALAEAAKRLGRIVFASDVSSEVATATAGASGIVAKSDPTFEVGPGVETRPSILPPFAELHAATEIAGHNLLVLDPDGPVRRAVPFVLVGGRPVPALPLAVAFLASGLAPGELRLDPAGLRFGPRLLPLVDAEIPTLAGPPVKGRRALINFRGAAVERDRTTFREYSFYDLFYSEQQLLAGEKPLVNPSAFKDTIVLVGTTAAGLHDVFTVPFAGSKMPGVQIHANVVDNVLSSGFIRPGPAWGHWIVYLVPPLVAALVCSVVGIWIGLGAALATLAALAGADLALFSRGTWLPLAAPALGTAAATFGAVAYQYFVEGREKRKVKQLFARFVSPDVFSHLLADPSRARLGGERREMSVLFSDIRGFTTFTEAGHPEAVVEQLNEYFSRMVEVVFAHRGTIDKFVGDMVMALFGAPLDDPDHADHALQAALGMRKALAELNERWAREGKPPFDIGIGVNAGEMIAGIIGGETIVSYTVIGDAVNLGSRLESLNKQYRTHIIISEFTRSRLRGRYDVRALGEVTVKGKTRPVEIFEVCGGEALAPVPPA